jgi:hypothetical protein
MTRFIALAAALLAFSFPLSAMAKTHEPMGDGDGTAPVRCSANDPTVWVNTATKVYHQKGDAYYGKTKAGKYTCTSQAKAMGAHRSGSKGAKSAPADDAAPATATKSKKHHKSSSAAPSDDATP